jgi:hypothetical protein
MRKLKKAATLTVLTLVLAMTPAVVNASLVYNWVGDTAQNGINSGGTLTVDTSGNSYSLVSLVFQYGTTVFSGSTFYGTISQLADGDLTLNGYAALSPSGLSWSVNNGLPSAGADENAANNANGSGSVTYGDWVLQSNVAVVPEPATVISGILLLLPLGVSAARILRKSRAV